MRLRSAMIAMAAVVQWAALQAVWFPDEVRAATVGRFPVLSVEKTCRGAPPLLSAETGAEQASPQSRRELAEKTYKSCMDSEDAARQQAQERWPHVKPENRTICFDLSRSIYPSYVELASCLQMYDPRVNAPGDSEVLQKSDFKSRVAPATKH